MPHHHKTLIFLLTTILFLAGCSSSAITPQQTAQNSPIAQSIGQKSSLSHQLAPSISEPGITVYIDPNTGEFISKPAVGKESLEVSPEMQNAMSTSDAGLYEERSTVPGGGYIIDLQGRFQSPLMHIQNPRGGVQTKHLDEIIKPAPK